MIYNKWIKWPLTKSLLRRADVLLVHNQDVGNQAKQLGLDAITLHDPMPILPAVDQRSIETRFSFTKHPYVIVPWSFAPDEPVREPIETAKSIPEIIFVITWFPERMSLNQDALPEGLVLTDYPSDDDFTGVFAMASVALILTTREGTQSSDASEAIALGAPHVLSDLKTTKRLYEYVPVQVSKTVDGIRHGVAQAFNEQDVLRKKFSRSERRLQHPLRSEIFDIAQLLRVQPQASRPAND